MNVWMSIDERNLVSKYLHYDKVMLEWGAGGSTQFFSKYVKRYISIEHEEEWYNKMKDCGAEIHLVKNNSPRTIPTKVEQFLDYVNYVDVLNEKYDLVLIDGRARPYCAQKVIPYLKRESIVFIHDFWARPEYHWVLKYYDEIESIKKGQTIVALRLK
jgi:predicted O-methyltransferase YrrM|tara:strand:- start:1619 stop:2092 length:474 start_codon:yes stop_codon:yes gene_type:complete